jgi:hypothetical protein
MLVLVGHTLSYQLIEQRRSFYHRIDIELQLKDLETIEKKIQSLARVIKSGDKDAVKENELALKIKDGLEKVRKAENLESIKVILIGVGNQGSVQTYLDNLHQQAGLDQFVWIGSADPKALAKMAAFVSNSISSSSQALGTGGPSQNLTV